MSDKIEVPLDEVKRLFLFLEELNHFFHQPMHYEDHAAVVKYIEGGMYEQIHSMYYHVVWNWLPPAVQKEIEDR